MDVSTVRKATTEAEKAKHCQKGCCYKCFQFIRSIADPLKDWAELTEQIDQAQQHYHRLLQDWKRSHPIQRQPTTANPKIELWHHQGCIVIPPDKPLRRNILYHHHRRPTMGHPGRDETIRKVKQTFWWPAMNNWVIAYVKGCATCQQNKNLTH